MADDLSLLFKLRADNAQAKAVMADTRAAVTSLRGQFGKDLTQMQGVAKTALGDIGENLNAFVGQRIPLIGGAFLRVTSNLRGLNDELKKGGPQTEKLAQQIDGIAKASGKSTTEITRFLTSFVRLESQAKRDAAALEFVGAAAAQKLIPQLEQAGSTMAALSTETTVAAASMASLAGPLAIVAAGVAAEIIVVTELTKQIFELARASADYQGKLFDLSQQVGISVETLSALEVAARTTGGSIEGLVQSLGIFQRKLEESVEDRGSKAATTLRKLGVDATDTEAALRQTIAALARMPEGFRQTALAMELFGRGGKQVLAVAKESKGDIDKITDSLRGLGLVTTDQAKLADEFNDQLVLLQTQLRGLGAEAIPVVLDVLRDLSQTLKENRDLFRFLQGFIKGLAFEISVVLKAALYVLRTEFQRVEPFLRIAAELFERIKDAIEFISGHPITLPGASSGPAAPPPPTTPSKDQRDPFTEELKDRVEAQKRLQGVLNFAFAERQRQAQDSIALAQREFEAGKRTRQQLLEATIEATRKQTKAEIDALEVDRQIKLQEQALAKDDLEKRTQIANAILAFDTQIANKRSEQARNEANLRAKAQLDEQKAELARYQAQTEITVRLGEQRIAAIEDLIQREQVSREIGLEKIEQIENAALAARGQILKRELQLAGVGPERQAVLDKIAAIETERTELERRQSERRRRITEDEFEAKRQIVLTNLDAILQVEQIRGETRIAAIKALAALGVKTEEQAAKDILAVRLRLLDAEIEATKIRQKAAAGIVDPKERRQAEADLINELEILNAQREAIQAEGNRAIDDARQEDLENLRRYNEGLRDLQERTRDIQIDTAAEVIRLMQVTFARRKDIIRAQRDLDLAEEADRHRRVTESITRQQQEVDAQIKVLEKHLDRLKIGTAEEIEEHDRLIQSLERLRLKRLELKGQQKAEEERSQTRTRTITTRAGQDEEEADPFGRIKTDLEDIKEFADELERSVVPLGEILAGTFNQVADAIGQTVANWVLLGETGPAVMRKILAQALASIAAEAAVNAIKELALGFATLFFNPAESAAHFTAAALWGSIGGVAAAAGRGVAGDLFKPKSSGAGTGGGGSQDRGQLNPLTFPRNQPQPLRLVVQLPTINVNPNDRFGQAVTATWADDYAHGGITREVVLNDGKT